MKRKGFFVTFEGPEGSGKTTQMNLLGEKLREDKIPYITTREPGGSKLTTHLRRWILDELGYALTFEAELFLFLADRAQHVQEVILPALRAGKIVLCDRFTDSTLAYQGGGRGFPIPSLRLMNQTATGGLRPDLTFLIDIPAREGLARAESRSGGKDRIEKEKLAFHRKVRSTYLKIARKEPGRFVVLKGLRPVGEIENQVACHILELLPANSRRLFQKCVRR